MKVNLSVLLRTHLQIQGASGSGKSWLVRLLAEQLFGKVPVIIIDQEGEYATLREKFDYILVGKGGETPTNIQSAGLLSHRLLELRASAVVDLYELDIPTRKIWIKRFFEGVMSAPKKYWRPTIFIIDEAHDFIPEKMESECAHILASAISKGRKRGFAFVCATQRLSKLNKDVASELQNVLIGKTWLDIDRERGASALGIYNKADKEGFYDEVKRLSQGQFYAQGAALSLDRVLFQTGSVQTTHPDSSNFKNKKLWLTPPPAPKAVAAMLGKLADLPKEAADEAQSISDFKLQIVKLKQDVKAAGRAVQGLPNDGRSTVAETKLKEKLDEVKKDLETYKTFAKIIGKMLKKREDQMAGAATLLLEGTKIVVPKFDGIPSLPEIKTDVQTLHGQYARTDKPIQIPTPIFRRERSSIDSDSEVMEGTLNNKQRDILRALAEFKAIGRLSIPRTWVAARSGASHRSSAYANNVSNLRSRGLIEYTGDGLALTEAGTDAAPIVDSPLSTSAMLTSCLRMLSNKQAAILTYLHGIYPNEATRENVAENSGASHQSSAYANNVSSLKSAGMITYTQTKRLRASDWMFID